MTIQKLKHTLGTIHISKKEYLGYFLLLLWILTMISLPIFRWIYGDSVLPTGVNIAAIFQASAVFFIVQQQWGLQRTLQTFGLVAVITWSAEALGHSTGFPFGAYHYTDTLQPQIFGVPALIPLAWFMLLPSSWVMAQVIVGERNSWQKEVTFITISALALTTWDLFLDPQMVAWNFWQWDVSGVYFGIPLSNYVGWIVVAAFVTLIVRPASLKIMPLALIYGIVWFLQSFGQAFFWGQIGPAIVGCATMGSIMVTAYLRRSKTEL